MLNRGCYNKVITENFLDLSCKPLGGIKELFQKDLAQIDICKIWAACSFMLKKEKDRNEGRRSNT